MSKHHALRAVLVAATLMFACRAGAAEFPDYPFIHTSGSGVVYVAPDLGEIDFEISLFNADPQAARVAVDARIAAIRALLDSAGVPSADIDIRDVRRDIRKADPAQAGLVQYDLKCGVHIKIADLSKWREVVGPLIVMPELDGFMIGFDSSKRAQVESELTAEALKAARRRAEAIADGVGRKLGLASAVSTGDLKNVTRAVGLGGVQGVGYRSPVRADPDREGLLMIVPMKLSQSVDVIYRFK
ncbi:SIMPL domain-containing protein [Massilia sp. DWR3-1-1]|uniref:SIMPL domain-containing protein n=1 Tax=Massilia sp. DWR3-1-1 TaxID=2804559 RepID=UPI003CF015B8